MSQVTARAPKLGNDKGRWSERPSSNMGLHIYGTNGDSANALRLQRLKLLGIIDARASLLASMAWEVAHG